MHLEVVKQGGCKRNLTNLSFVSNTQISIYTTNTPRGNLKNEREANDDKAEETYAREDSIKAMEVEAGPQTSLKMYLS